MIGIGSQGSPFKVNQSMREDYDYVERVIKEMEERLLEQAPGWCRVTRAVLCGHDISQMTMLTKAMSLFEQSEGKADWRNIPEKYWEMALESFGV